MKNSTSYLVLITLLGLAVSTLAENVHWRPCPPPNNSTEHCTIHEVIVEPCREAANKKPCRIRKGHPATITFDYTPNFSGDGLQSRAYWMNDVFDIPFMGMKTDACNSTVCPAVPGTRQTYSYSLPISRSFPIRTYDIKWKLWKTEDKPCCFTFDIRLTR